LFPITIIFIYSFALCFPFEAVALFALPAQLPYNTLGAILAVGTGIRTGLTVIQALLTIAYSHFLALNVGLTVRMISALHCFFSFNPG